MPQYTDEEMIELLVRELDGLWDEFKKVTNWKSEDDYALHPLALEKIAVLRAKGVDV